MISAPVRTATLALSVWLMGCSAEEKDFREVEVRSAITHVMAEQEAAWDRGDIRGFMAGYTEAACFITAKERTCGREAVTQRYLKRYPDKSAMGDLRFGISEVLAVGQEHAWCTGTWTLVRSADTLSGGFSLLWQRETDGWRVVRDHTY
ncbi:MAG: nuclear transport factor 2 family protein [Flavobacteriales bacterium]|jgi:ketosteroid isomerase-like protein|nr:nuclear transport factor 2 family protein [Flavobacteriales bacterium]MBK7941130.1 nuclear transport factor 2 family protein [Flavobacteriales bacterium]MBK8948790.1 nuclear transport factor 2 family protein [Flavobacteriales bacterium]MBK9701156.1 nuclear transport factor 2 family protein [Flavobacteriales bacterium]